jgi:cell division protein FtsQ
MRPRWLRTRRRTVLVVAIAGTIVVATAASAITFTPVFGARRIDVTGNRTLETEEVLAAAGLELGVNVAHLDTRAVEDRLRADPWVEEAIVERDLPGTIVVRVRERVPVATLLGGTAVAGDGTVLPDAPVARLPEIRASYGSLEPASASAAAAAVAALSPGVRGRVLAVVVQPDGWMHVQLRNGVGVIYGDASHPGAKAASLQAILRWANDAGSSLQRVDVSVPSTPSATLAGGSTYVP